MYTGLAVDDWRYGVRVANIDLSNLIAGTGADLPDRFIQASHMIPDYSGIRPSFYTNRTVYTWLDLQCRNDVTTGGQLSYQVVDGKRIDTFRGIAVTTLDRLTQAESALA